MFCLVRCNAHSPVVVVSLVGESAVCNMPSSSPKSILGRPGTPDVNGIGLGCCSRSRARQQQRGMYLCSPAQEQVYTYLCKRRSVQHMLHYTIRKLPGCLTPLPFLWRERPSWTYCCSARIPVASTMHPEITCWKIQIFLLMSIHWAAVPVRCFFNALCHARQTTITTLEHAANTCC